MALLGVAACSSGGAGRTDSGYCAAVQANLAELNSPGISVPGDVSRTVELYTTMAKAAPLAVEKEWDILSIAYATAATVVPGDPASLQKAADTIRSAQQSATAVADYTRRLCQVDLGAPTVPTTLLSGSTTTDPNATTTTSTVDPAAAAPPAAPPAMPAATPPATPPAAPGTASGA